MNLLIGLVAGIIVAAVILWLMPYFAPTPIAAIVALAAFLAILAVSA